MANLAPKPKKKGIMRKITDAAGITEKEKDSEVLLPEDVIEEPFLEIPAPQIEKPKVAVKTWVKQPAITVDLDPSIALMISDLQKENDELRSQFERNVYARKRAMQSVLKNFEINTNNIDSVKFLKTEFGTYQLSVPQPDKLVEK